MSAVRRIALSADAKDCFRIAAHEAIIRTIDKTRRD
jgi:hypothetical protein